MSKGYAFWGVAFAAAAIFAIIPMFLIAMTKIGMINIRPQHAVCLQSHREVVFIPTICGDHDVCQKPIVAEVCERIESPAPQPLRQSSGADDDE